MIRYLLLILFMFSIRCAPRPWTKEEKIMLGASCLAVAADMTTTINGMHNGNSETNPTMGEHPSDAVVISVMALTQVATIVLAHYWEGFRVWILGTKTGINVGFAFHNIRTD